MPLEDLARSEVVTVKPGTSVPETASKLENEDVGSVVVVEGGKPVGIITDRDLALRVLSDDRDTAGLSAEDVMSDDLCTAHPDDGFAEAARMMSENAVRRLPICDDDGELKGIITADDMTELLADEQQQLAEVIRAQRPSY
ncbi:MAG: CBS domain-containing protein [Halobacteriales archaeon]|nr:CBS domain-containing protein [Halobacteriales archaeon]